MLRGTLAQIQKAGRAFSTCSVAGSSTRDVLTAHLVPASLPPTLARKAQPHKNLYQLLSTLPNDGVGARVRQRRWAAKGLDVPADVNLKTHLADFHAQGASRKPRQDEFHCYWQITKVKLKDGGNHGKAWGKLVWRGKTITSREEGERIPGSLKYLWAPAH